MFFVVTFHFIVDLHLLPVRYRYPTIINFQALRSNEIRTLNPLRDLDKVAMNKLGLLRPRIPVSFGLGMPAHSCNSASKRDIEK
jgi:hypothetical protein